MQICRSIAFLIYAFFLTLWMGITAFPIRWAKDDATALRHAKLWSSRTLAGLQRICRITITITGREHLPGGSFVIVSQHQSFFDGFVWMNLVTQPSYIIKSELTRIPLVGPMLIAAGMIPIERSAGSRALRDMLLAAKTKFQLGRQIIIFPHGTRTSPGERAPIQPGVVALAKAGLTPFIPVATNSGLCWPRSGWRKFSGEITVAIGPALDNFFDRQSLTHQLEDAWNKLL